MNDDWIVIAWYRREDYDRIYSLAPNGGGMEPTFDDWQRFVDGAMPAIEARGVPIKKVIIEPDDFAGWLRAQNLESSPETRARYAFEIAPKAKSELH
jgi:hypothetical protein